MILIVVLFIQKKNSCIGDQVPVELRREEEERVLEYLRRDDVLSCEYNNRLGSYSATQLLKDEALK
jgi:hypothetical protein